MWWYVDGLWQAVSDHRQGSLGGSDSIPSMHFGVGSGWK